MSKRRTTFQITLDLRAGALLAMMLLLVGLMIVPTVARAFPRGDEPEPQAYDAQNADKVDGHHAASSSATKAKRANRVLWADKSGRLHWKAMPAGQLNGRYLNDDRQETIQAAVNGPVLRVNNTGTGVNVWGLWASGRDRGVYGESPYGDAVYGYSSGTGRGVSGISNSGRGVYGYSYSGIAVYGESTGGTGVEGSSANGTGVHASSTTNLPLRVEGAYGDNLIEAWDIVAYPGNLRFKVTTAGDVRADGTFTGGGADFAEMMATSEGVTYEHGDLLVIGPDGKPLLSSAPNATDLLGVYSSDPGFVGGVGEDGDRTGKIPVAITGIVPVKASTENGAILPGDLLTSSSTPGHAMKASPVVVNGITLHIPGTILGKALEPLEEGTGVILVLVTLQ